MAEKPEVVVITGASAGVGRAAVRRFAREGAYIGLVARGTDGLEAARAEVEARGGKALVLPADVADAAQVEAAAEKAEAELGPIDIWVNDAMTTIFAPFLEITPEEYRRATEVTYLGAVYGTMAALKRMVSRDRGTIVQVGSALAYRSIPLQAPYCGAKAAIRGFTDSIRTELVHRKSKVHLTMVQMPALNTPQFGWCATKLPNHPQPVPPIFQPEVAADAIYFAAHSRRRELYVGHSTVMAILGNKLAPGTRRPVPGGDRLSITADGRTGDAGPAQQPLRAGAGRSRSTRHLRRPRERQQPPTLGRYASRPRGADRHRNRNAGGRCGGLRPRLDSRRSYFSSISSRSRTSPSGLRASKLAFFPSMLTMTKFSVRATFWVMPSGGLSTS